MKKKDPQDSTERVAPTKEAIDRAIKWLRNIEYLDDWQFSMTCRSGQWPTLTVVTPPLEDSTDLWKTMGGYMNGTLQFTHNIPFDPDYLVSEKKFVNHVLRLTAGIQVHEVMEFMRYKGDVICCPHRKKDNQPLYAVPGVA
jgi:hypothetical protein